MTSATDLPWRQGTWLNPPPSVRDDGTDLVVGCAQGSDLWRTTSYGFVHDDGHALLSPFAVGSAVEVAFVADFDEQFDQAGVLVRAGPATWVKAGTEFCDGVLQAGSVVTHGMSDVLRPVAGHRLEVRFTRWATGPADGELHPG